MMCAAYGRGEMANLAVRLLRAVMDNGIQSSTHRRTIYKAPYDHAQHGDKRDYI